MKVQTTIEQQYLKRVGEVPSLICLYDIIYSAVMSVCCMNGVSSSSWLWWGYRASLHKRGRTFRKSCISIHLIMFDVIIIPIFSHNRLIICCALNGRWFSCFFYLNYPTYHCPHVTYSIISYVISFTNFNSMFVIRHPTDLASGKFISWSIIDVTYFFVIVVIEHLWWCPWQNHIYRIFCLNF